MGLGANIGKRFGSNIRSMPKGELATNLAPDILFGAMYGAMSPGDFDDKLIAGLGSGLGGAAGGVGLRAGLGIKNPALGFVVDMGGSIAGDMAGVGIADQVLRVKNGGFTPMESENMRYQRQLEQQIRGEVLDEIRQQSYRY